MNNQILFIALAGSTGVFCLIFTNTVMKWLSAFAQLSAKMSFSKIEAKESKARPFFIRLMGVAQIGMAIFVYYSSGGIS